MPREDINVDVSQGSVLQDPNNPTAKAQADIAQTFGLGPNAGFVVAELRSFTEAGAAGVLTASVDIPAGAFLLDIQLYSTVLWAAGTTASMKVGDAADDDGYYVDVDLKASGDLLVGEVIRFESPSGAAGAVVGADIVLATGEIDKAYAAAGRRISGVITTVGTTSTAGRTFMLVKYVVPTAVAATYVAT